MIVWSFGLCLFEFVVCCLCGSCVVCAWFCCVRVWFAGVCGLCLVCVYFVVGAVCVFFGFWCCRVVDCDCLCVCHVFVCVCACLCVWICFVWFSTVCSFVCVVCVCLVCVCSNCC